MKDFIHTARGSLLFWGIAETEIREMLGCLDAKVREFRQGGVYFPGGRRDGVDGAPAFREGVCDPGGLLGEPEYCIHGHGGTDVCGDVRLRAGGGYDGERHGGGGLVPCCF